MLFVKDLLIGLALIIGAAWGIRALWRPVPPIWSGTRRHVPFRGGRVYLIHPRSYLTGILPLTALLASLIALGLQFLVHGCARLDPALYSLGPARAFVLLGALAVPLTVLQWVVNAVNRPARLVPPGLRDEPGWVARRWRPAEVTRIRNMRHKADRRARRRRRQNRNEPGAVVRRQAGQARTPNVR
ncbi:hypothetical protein [Catellatospora coxensis]|uniref:hypothetical protein n=1 Tax=Catellatospora coxensis TaxID=310354 RepID=UPI001941EC1E|nr:hypothetical protein [Catellatospora coxensis]